MPRTVKVLMHALRRTPSLALAVAALIALTAGLSLAAATGSGTVHACYAKRGGALRVLSHGRCSKQERALSWAQRGPTGPRGLTGPRGVTGPRGFTGAPGPSAVYTKYIGTIDPLGTDGSAITGSLSVPAGSYLVMARADFYNSGPNAGDRPGCAIFGGADPATAPSLDTETDELGANAVGSFHIFGGVSLVGTTTFSSPGTITINCSQVGADTHVSASAVRLTAIAVGSLNDQS